MEKVIQVIRFSDNKIEHEINVSNKTDRQIEKIENGININLDHDRFYTITKEV